MEHKENINEWQQIDEWNMLVIKENYLEVHDQASSTNNPPNQDSSSHERENQFPLLQLIPTDGEDGASSSPVTASGSESGDAVGVPLDWRARVEGVRESVSKVASRVCDWTMCRGAFWSFGCVAGAAAAVLVAVVYVIRRRRGRSGRRNMVVDRWVCLLKEKDEKIGQLLFQIAQLNEVLSSRRKVPVYQIN
ncbi:hypothetical protein VNO78_12198 [Psophocarpus tetragonolobus]|uniref:Transmembrane protein n=1 Tax=Psophocarpus tetragonolobus TaxID=3891 RepID=A0AAN9SMK4_PSOTE